VKDMKRPEGFGEAAFGPMFKRGVALIWKRIEPGKAGIETNVKWKVRHHSPDGFEIGYAGSGPADLALNAMAALFPCRVENYTPVWDGKVSHKAWMKHQAFKFRFLQNADRNAGRIEWAEIEAWLRESDNGR